MLQNNITRKVERKKLVRHLQWKLCMRPCYQQATGILTYLQAINCVKYIEAAAEMWKKKIERTE